MSIFTDDDRQAILAILTEEQDRILATTIRERLAARQHPAAGKTTVMLLAELHRMADRGEIDRHAGRLVLWAARGAGA